MIFRDTLSTRAINTHALILWSYRFILRIGWLLPLSSVALAAPTVNSLDDGHCVTITTIDIQGATLLNAETLSLLKAPFMGQCLSIEKMDNLIKNINDHYLQQGFLTTRVGLPIPQQGLQQGRLLIAVSEGRVEEVLWSDGRKMPFNLFPGLVGRVLNIRDLEQSLAQINRLHSQHATLDIRPGQHDAQSQIVIQNQPDYRGQLSLSYDNSGSPSTGVAKRNIHLTTDNITGLYDYLNIRYGGSYREDKTQKMSQSWSFDWDIPYGYWIYSYSGSESGYLTSQTLRNNEVLYTTGNTLTHSLNFERLFHHSQIASTQLNFSLTVSDTESFTRIRDLISKSTVGSRTVSIAKLGAATTWTLQPWSLSLHPSCSRGLRLFGALDDRLDEYEEKAQFTACAIQAQVHRRFSFYDTPVNWSLSLNSQYSVDALFGAQQFSIGGQSSVKGFKTTSTSGESGYSLQNSLRFSLSETMSLSFFGDYGRIHNRLNEREDSLAGVGIGFTYRVAFMDFSITVSRSLLRPDYFEDEGQVIDASITFKTIRQKHGS